MEETGVVKEIRGSLALVSLKADACANCASRVKIGLKTADGSQEVWARNLAHAKPGDRVIIDIPEDKFRARLKVFYILPLAAILAGIGIGKWAEHQPTIISKGSAFLGKEVALLIFSGNNLSLVVGVVFAAASFAVIWALSRGPLAASVARILEGQNGQTG